MKLLRICSLLWFSVSLASANPNKILRGDLLRVHDGTGIILRIRDDEDNRAGTFLLHDSDHSVEINLEPDIKWRGSVSMIQSIEYRGRKDEGEIILREMKNIGGDDFHLCIIERDLWDRIIEHLQNWPEDLRNQFTTIEGITSSGRE